MLNRDTNSKMNGFSLIELIVTLAVIGVLATLAMSSYQEMIQNNRIRTAAESIQNGIQLARGEAVKRNATVQFDLRGADSDWTVCLSPNVPDSCPAADDATTLQSRSSGEGSSSYITVAASDAGPYVFNSLGVMTSPVPAGGGVVSIDVDISPSVLAAEKSRELRVLLGVGGSSRMCDPALPSAGTDPRRCP